MYLLEDVTVDQLVNKFPSSYRNQNLITIFVTALKWTIS